MLGTRPDQYARSQIGHYEVISEIGHGGMGTVYRAYDAALERPVALKVLAPDLAHDPRFVARLRHEAISAARLRHPHIALLYEFGQDNDLSFLAMEYVSGSSLRQILEAGPLAPQRVLVILRQIAEALEYAHTMGVVHRDVKPSNILVGPDDLAVLIDFGLAELAEDPLLTGDSALLGTPHYMSPEQALGQVASGWSDQYALAAVAYEMLTGVAPFHGRIAAAVVHAHIYERPPAATECRPSLPASVNDVLLRALAKKPEARYPLPTAFVAELQAALASPAQRRRNIRYRLLAAASVLALVVAAALAWWNIGAAQATLQPSTGQENALILQEVKWNYDLGLVGTSAPVAVANTLVFESLDGSLVALDAGTGDYRWAKDSAASVFGVPSAGAGLIFVGNAAGAMLCLDPQSGAVIWEQHLIGGVRQAPTRSNDRLIVTTVKRYVYALHAGTGQVLWSLQLADNLGVPTVGAGNAFVAAGRSLFALDLNTGALTWTFEAPSAITTQPVIWGNLVLVGTESGMLYGLQTADHVERLRYAARGAISAAPAVAADALFVADRSGMLTALRPDNHQRIWNFETDTAITAAPLLADGRLFLGTGSGRVYSLDARSGRELAMLQLKGSIVAAPALGADLVYVRANRIYALGP
jgi:outer membrane protein assembly factor BamB/predicted Ser/Thr protein kinase